MASESQPTRNSSNSGSSSPELPSQSRGSSVSTSLREEYEDLLRYAVVTPAMNGRTPRQRSSATPSHRQTPGVVATRVEPLELGEEDSEGESDSDASASRSGCSTTTVESRDPPQPAEHVLTATTTNMYHSHSTRPPPTHSPRPQQHHVSSHPLPPPSHSRPQQHHVSSHPPPPSPPHSTYSADDIDPELARIDSQLDIWCQDLKTNVLAEFEQVRMRLREQLLSELEKAKARQSQETVQLHSEVDRGKQVMVTYEQSMARKDQIINSLTRALAKQKERVELQKVFGAWKLRHVDEKREMFTSSLARLHHGRIIKRRVLRAWFGVIHGRWKRRVERACQTRAEEVCRQIAHEYEDRLAAAQRSHEEAQIEMARMREQRDVFAESMKTAFMRGVCALNMEAMTMFRSDQTDGHHDNGLDDDDHHDDCHHGNNQSTGIVPAAMPALSVPAYHRSTQPPSHLHTSHSSSTGARRTAATKKRKPPSVVVERHFTETQH